MTADIFTAATVRIAKPRHVRIAPDDAEPPPFVSVAAVAKPPRWLVAAGLVLCVVAGAAVGAWLGGAW
jgi:hypothetical protein